MKLRKIILFITFTLSAQFAFSQSVQAIAGRVENKTGKGVPFLSVYVKDTTAGTTTDKDGNFVLSGLPEEDIILGISGIGYKTILYPLSEREQTEKLSFVIEQDDLLLNEVVVSGSQVGLLRYLPGTVSIIRQDAIRKTAAVSSNELLRTIPGVNVVEEEGAGLRANIGIRGLDPDRSRNVLVLEDGIPLALAPYGEPEMYYSPNIERMSGLELLKGNGSILFGPQTVGGVLNYTTADPTENLSGIFSFKGGDFGYNNSFISISNKHGNIGYLVNYNRKQAREFGPTEFLLHDFNSKFSLNLSPQSKLMLKISLYNESSNATYVGITQAMYNSEKYDYTTIVPDDKLSIRRYALSAKHKHQIADGLEINTTVFAYNTTRNWNRQNFTYDPNASNLTSRVYGEDYDYEGAIFLRNGTGQRNRQFEVAGIEPRLSYRYEMLNAESKIDAGVRLLFEKAYEQRVNGSQAGMLSGELLNDEIRSGNAFSSFVQNKTIINNHLSFTAGLRTENIWYERNIYRTAGADTLIGNTTGDFALIPGFGLNYNLTENTGLFTGVHRGYAPPRTKDAISNHGEDLELEAENSWSYELGLRSNMNFFDVDITAFYMDFSNQIIPVSESSGGSGTGYINGGATTHKGVEMSLRFPFQILPSKQLSNSIVFSGTYSDSRFASNRFVVQKINTDTNEPVYVNVKNNKTPYAPELRFSAALETEFSNRAGIRISTVFVGEQYTDALNTDDVTEWIQVDTDDTGFAYRQASMNGRIGKMDSYFLCDATLWYATKIGLNLNVSVKNVFNERYIASRRPQGIRVGMPRFVSAGISYAF